MKIMNEIPYWIWKSIISPETCNTIIKEYFNKEQSMEGVYNNMEIDGDSKIRKTNVCWADQDSHLSCMLFNYILLANQKTNWFFDITEIAPVQIGEYEIGGKYDWHPDAEVYERNGTGYQRKISLTLQLSDPNSYEGGDLEFEGSRGSITVPKDQGTIIVFPSSLSHRVTPVTKGIRYSAVGWASGPYFK